MHSVTRRHRLGDTGVLLFFSFFHMKTAVFNLLSGDFHCGIDFYWTLPCVSQSRCVFFKLELTKKMMSDVMEGGKEGGKQGEGTGHHQIFQIDTPSTALSVPKSL